MRLTMITALAALVVAATVAEAQRLPKGKTIVPERDWAAIVKGDAEMKKAPKNGLLTNQKDFAELWKAWRAEEKVPEIDFKQKFAVVSLASGPNRPQVKAVLTDEGNLEISAISTLVGGPGFGYSIAVFERKGVRKVNGKDFPKE